MHPPIQHWPVPQSYSKKVPQRGHPGSFWENRGDRFHCGVDIYAPRGCDVIAVDGGIVLQIENFSSSEKINYWNDTVAVTLKHTCGLIVRYAELLDVLFKQGESVEAGAIIGHVGQVLAPARITDQAPLYIQKLKEKNNSAMLHLEIFEYYPFDIPKYFGGNTFQKVKPAGLLDPTDFLR